MIKVRRGFTLIELLIVLAVMGLLLSLVVPRFFSGVERAREVALKENLNRMRTAIEKFYEDTGRYPNELSELVEKKYLRGIPSDPMAEAQPWTIVAPDDPKQGKVFDVRSGATGMALDGTQYTSW